MSDLILQNITNSIFLMPIRSIHFYKTVEAEWLIIEQLEAESSFRVSPITRQNAKGFNVTIGYNIEIVCYVPHNDYGSNGLITKIEEINSVDNQIFLKMGNTSEIFYDAKDVLNATGKQRLILWEGAKTSMEFESVELRPRLILRINKIKRNLVNLFYS